MFTFYKQMFRSNAQLQQHNINSKSKSNFNNNHSSSNKNNNISTTKTTTYRATFSLDEVDGLDHVEAQLDAAVGVVGSGNRQSGHAVVAIAQKLDPETVTHL